MQQEKHITVAILAGGAARRFDGRDKGLQRLGDQPLIAWVIDSVNTQDCEVMIVANRNLETYREYAPVISDATPGFAGPLAGIAVALTSCRSPWLLTVPVDCPQPPADLAARLLDAARSGPADHDAWVAHDGERRQPLFALYRPILAPSAAAAVAAGHGVMHWQEAIGFRAVDFSDARAHFINLNRESEFRAFLDMQSRPHA